MTSPGPETREEASFQAPAPSRSPWQRFYAAVHRLRRRWFRDRARHLPRPVISVGNLHWGGTGKTPTVAALAAHLRDQGSRVAILSRGYHSRGRGVRLVSAGEGPLLGPLVAGDEPVLLAGQLPGVAVVVAGDRHEAGRHALERLDPAPDLFLLDDGFSHLRLHRDLDVLLFPDDDPYGKGLLLPGGRLREPLAAVRHADAVLLTGPEPGSGEAFAESLRPHGFTGPGFSNPVVPRPPRLDGEPVPVETPVLLVAAIARPQRFREAVERLGHRVADQLWLPDHHPYPEETLRRIEEARARAGADLVLTTAKDHVKLRGRCRAPVAEVSVEARPEEAFWGWLESRLGELWR